MSEKHEPNGYVWKSGTDEQRTAQTTIQDPPEYNAGSAKSLAAQKDQSPTFDQLDADLQGLISQFQSFISLPDSYGPTFASAGAILETFCSPNQNAENGDPMTANDAYWKIYQISGAQ
jgi:hypothetical protein